MMSTIFLSPSHPYCIPFFSGFSRTNNAQILVQCTYFPTSQMFSLVFFGIALSTQRNGSFPGRPRCPTLWRRLGARGMVVFPPKWVVKIMETPMTKWDDLRVFSHYFWKHPFVEAIICLICNIFIMHHNLAGPTGRE